MAQLRSNEWNFTSDAAAQEITEVLKGEAYGSSPLGRVGAELTEATGSKRLALVLFNRQLPGKPLVTAELKVPWDALGRTPHHAQVVEDAHRKASKCGAKFFVTWKIAASSSGARISRRSPAGPRRGGQGAHPNRPDESGGPRAA